MQGVDQAAGRPGRPVQELDGKAAAAGRPAGVKGPSVRVAASPAPGSWGSGMTPTPWNAPPGYLKTP